MENDLDTLLTVKETATFLKLNPITIYEYIRLGKLQAVKFGRNYRVVKRDLFRFIEEHRQSP